MRSKPTKSMSLFLIVICGSDANLNEVLLQQAPLYAVSQTPHIPPSTIKHMLCWVILLWVLLLAMKNVSTCGCAFNRCTFWMAWAETTHACTILGCCRVCFFFVSANRLTSSSGQIECARSDFCRETLFSHCSAMWLTSSSFCSQLFCVFNSVTS